MRGWTRWIDFQGSDAIAQSAQAQFADRLGELFDDAGADHRVVVVGRPDLHCRSTRDEKLHRIIDGGYAADSDDRYWNIRRDLVDAPQCDGLDRRSAHAPNIVGQHGLLSPPVDRHA